MFTVLLVVDAKRKLLVPCIITDEEGKPALYQAYRSAEGLVDRELAKNQGNVYEVKRLIDVQAPATSLN